jgi:hypothetical protein
MTKRLGVSREKRKSGRLSVISVKYKSIVKSLADFRSKSKRDMEVTVCYNEIKTARNYSTEYRKRQVVLLGTILESEIEIVSQVETLLRKLEVYSV